MGLSVGRSEGRIGEIMNKNRKTRWELQVKSGEELSALLPSVLDRAFKGEL